MHDEQDNPQDAEDRTEAAEVEGHRRKFKGRDDAPPPEGAEREQPADDEDDVEGHRFYNSDIRLKTGIRAL